MRHAHMGNPFHSGFFAEMSSSKSPLSRIAVRVKKFSPESAVISQSSLIMHANYKILTTGPRALKFGPQVHRN